MVKSHKNNMYGGCNANSIILDKLDKSSIQTLNIIPEYYDEIFETMTR